MQAIIIKSMDKGIGPDTRNLTTMFIVLKLTNLIDGYWVFVLSPSLIFIVIILGLWAWGRIDRKR